MEVCTICGKETKSHAGLVSHTRLVHKPIGGEVKIEVEELEKTESVKNEPTDSDVETVIAHVEPKEDIFETLYGILRDGDYRLKLRLIKEKNLSGESLREAIAELHQYVKEGEIKMVIQEILNKL